jgi:hypothetical protein
MSLIDVSRAFEKFVTDKIIVKPIVSTSATDTYLLAPHSYADLQSELLEKFDERPFVA